MTDELDFYSQSKETKEYWLASGDNWESRIEHDEDDHWVWWVVVNDGEYRAEGSVLGSQDSVEGFDKARLFVRAVVDCVRAVVDCVRTTLNGA